MKLSLSSPCQQLAGVGPQLAQALARLQIFTLADLIEHLPRRYEDFSKISPIGQVKPGPITIRGQLKQVKGRYLKRDLHLTQAVVSDQTGSLAVIWFNQPFRLQQIKAETEYFLSGEYNFNQSYLQLRNPRLEVVSQLPNLTARILPIYPATKNLNSHQLTKLMASARPVFKELAEVLPESILTKAQLLAYSELLDKLHFPKTSQDIELAQTQLGLRQLIVITIASELLKQELEARPAPVIKPALSALKQIVADLPFELTDGQRRLTYQLIQRFNQPSPANCLVQADVGSGKTIIALLAAANVIAAGGQVALMAPTALLAAQHAQTAQELLTGFLAQAQLGLLIGQLKPKAKTALYQQIKTGQAKLVIGTQALLTTKLRFAKLQLVIVDEQHRFGVEQRQDLLAKADQAPHLLSLTATPIPRSLQLTIFRELEVFNLTERPACRLEVTTEIVPLAARRELFKRLLGQARADHKLYIVCPAIDSEEVSDPLKAACQLIESLAPNLKYLVLHGRHKQAEREAVMSKFVDGDWPILVTTRVIEAGIDVPTANSIIIMSPERFGLAQLHQLRGRVGRADQAGYCYLCQADNQPAAARLQAVARSNDGFYLSQLDLDSRGPGEIYGTRQSGPISKLSQLSLADEKLRLQALELATEFVANKPDLLEYPKLKQAVEAVWQVTNLN